MNLGELRELLDRFQHVPDATPVILQKDAEGNGYSPLSGGAVAWYVPYTSYSGEVYTMPHTENDDTAEPGDAVPAVVLWPVN